MFWHIVNHEDAVLIKIELSKALTDFTKTSISHLVEDKKKLTKQKINTSDN